MGLCLLDVLRDRVQEYEQDGKYHIPPRQIKAVDEHEQYRELGEAEHYRLTRGLTYYYHSTLVWDYYNMRSKSMNAKLALVIMGAFICAYAGMYLLAVGVPYVAGVVG